LDATSTAGFGATATATFGVIAAEGVTATEGFGAGAGAGIGSGAVVRATLRDLNHLITISIRTIYRPAAVHTLMDSFPDDLFNGGYALLDFEQPAPPERDHAAGNGYLP